MRPARAVAGDRRAERTDAGDEFIERAQRQAVGIDEDAALAGQHLVAQQVQPRRRRRGLG